MFSAFVLSMVTVAGCAMPVQPGMDKPNAKITIYSPAAPPNPMWKMNEAIGVHLDLCMPEVAVETIDMPLPDSINFLSERPDRDQHLPIVTTVDFLPAVKGKSVDWHDYPKANGDLKFVASLYEVGLGTMVFNETIVNPGDLRGKTIAVPKRPSSLRVATEALLFDAWDLEGDVTLIDLSPSAVVAAARSGDIDATTWNLMMETDAGMRPLLPPLIEVGTWLTVTASDIDKINAANAFQMDLAAITEPATGEALTAVSFRQALAAWKTTDDDTVTDILNCFSKSSEAISNLTAGELANWPGLTQETLHPAAIQFFNTHDVSILGDAQ